MHDPFENNFSFKHIMKTQTNTNNSQKNQNSRLSPVRLNEKINISDKHKRYKDSTIKHRSQRQFKKQIPQSSSLRKLAYKNGKIYKSYSQTKNSINEMKKQKKKQFLIRIPNDQNLIENYIEQLKKLKRKINEQKSHLHASNQRRQQTIFISHKKQQEKIKQQENETVKKMKINNFNKGEQTTKTIIKQNNLEKQALEKSDKKIFIRDKMKHKTKLKIVKQFIEENQIQSDEDNAQNVQHAKQSNIKLSQRTNSQIQPSFQPSQQLHPKKIIYGDIINVKQNIKITSPFQSKKFQRYTSQSGRRLYSISKSTQLRQKTKQRMHSQEKKTKNFPQSFSMILRRKKTEQIDSNNGVEKQRLLKKDNLVSQKLYQSILKEKEKQANINPKIQKTALRASFEKFRSQRLSKNSSQKQQINSSSPKKTKNSQPLSQQIKQNVQNKIIYKKQQIRPLPTCQESKLQPKNPFKSIQGFSTIQDKKETLDILGQSCKQIKINLILQSPKKVDHILDLLGYNTDQLKNYQIDKIKKRKQSYQRFNKIFPKGFFQ